MNIDHRLYLQIFLTSDLFQLPMRTRIAQGDNSKAENLMKDLNNVIMYSLHFNLDQSKSYKLPEVIDMLNNG